MVSSFRLRLAGVAILLVTLAASLTACGGDSGPAAKSNSDLLKEGVANMKAAKSYHLDADITQSGQEVKINGDIDLAAKNLKLSMGTAGQTFDVIKVGNDFYSSTDGGKTYTKTDSSAVPDLSSVYGMWDTINPADVDKAKDALKDGTPPTEQIDGADTKHMTGSNKDLSSFVASSGSSSNDGTLDFWVSTDAKPTVRQMKVTSSDVNGTFKWSNIDAPVNITAPQTSNKLDVTASR